MVQSTLVASQASSLASSHAWRGIHRAFGGPEFEGCLFSREYLTVAELGLESDPPSRYDTAMSTEGVFQVEQVKQRRRGRLVIC